MHKPHKRPVIPRKMAAHRAAIFRGDPSQLAAKTDRRASTTERPLLPLAGQVTVRTHWLAMTGLCKLSFLQQALLLLWSPEKPLFPATAAFLSAVARPYFPWSCITPLRTLTTKSCTLVTMVRTDRLPRSRSLFTANSDTSTE